MAKKYLDQFYLVNIKNVAKFEGKINGRHFMLCGKNKVGKTSTFQIIRRLLAALPDAEKPEIWLKRGEDNGEMRVVLVHNGDIYFVEEKLSKTGRSRIRLWKQAGDDKRDELVPAQKRLQEIFGAVMDLSPLLHMTGAEQFKFLKDNLNLDTSQYEADRKKLVADRAKIKGEKLLTEELMKQYQVTDEEATKYREAKDITAVLKKKIDVAPLRQEHSDLTGHLTHLETVREGVAEIEHRMKALQKELARMQKELAMEPEVKKEALEMLDTIEEARKFNDDVDEEIKMITAHNAIAQKVVVYQEKKTNLTAIKARYDGVQDKIAGLDKEFYDRLAALPFDEVAPGLKLMYTPKDEDTEEQIGLYLNDLPFNARQGSYGESIKIVIKLACMLNPDGLNFVYISEWDKLDSEGKQELLDFANSQENVQLGIEKVDDKTEIAIEFIELNK